MLGSTLRTLRRARAWSQVHLAEAAGVGLRTVQRVERTGRCTDQTLLALAAALDVDARDLVAMERHETVDRPHLWHHLESRCAAAWLG